MKHVAAYLLLTLAGKEPSADGIKSIVEAAGGEVDSDAVDRLFKALEGKDLNEIIEAGKKKLVNIGGGGGGGGGGAAAGAAGADAGAAAAEEEEEEEEEESVEGAGGLFGDSSS